MSNFFVLFFLLNQLISRSICKNHPYLENTMNMIENKEFKASATVVKFYDTYRIQFNKNKPAGDPNIAVHHQVVCDTMESDDNLCSKFIIHKAECENLNYKNNVLPEFRCYYQAFKNPVKIEYEVKCQHPFADSEETYVTGTCYLRYILKEDYTVTYIIIGSSIGGVSLLIIVISLIIYYNKIILSSINGVFKDKEIHAEEPETIVPVDSVRITSGFSSTSFR